MQRKIVDWAKLALWVISWAATISLALTTGAGLVDDRWFALGLLVILWFFSMMLTPDSADD